MLKFFLILWNYLPKNWENLPPVSLIPMVHLDLQISPRIFEKTRNKPNAIFKGLRGRWFHEKKPEAKNLVTLSTVPVKRIEQYFVLCAFKVWLIYVDSVLDCSLHQGNYLHSHTEVLLLFQVSSADAQTKTYNDIWEFFRFALVSAICTGGFSFGTPRNKGSKTTNPFLCSSANLQLQPERRGDGQYGRVQVAISR